MSLESILSMARQPSTQSIDTLQKSEFIAFNWQNAHYALAIDMILEVVEGRAIAPYPTWQKGHLGIVNIRGRVLPVVHLLINNSEFKCCRTTKSTCQLKQILVIDHAIHGPYGLAAESAHKIIVDGLKENLEGRTIKINDKPIKILADFDLDFFRGITP